MSNTIDRIFGDVCLDERISDGIFRMDEEQHMNALRDYFTKRGLAKEDVISVTNRMTEGKYPDRQAYRTEDGILVTWPSTKHMQKAMKENPGKYTDKNPFPKQSRSPETDPDQKRGPEPESKPEPEVPSSDKNTAPDDASPAQNIFPSNASAPDNNAPVVSGDGKRLDVEPILNKPTAPSQPQSQPIQKTPEKISAEKEVVKQIFSSDDTALTDISSPIYVNEVCRKELTELYKKANELGYKNAITFLTPYVTS